MWGDGFDGWGLGWMGPAVMGVTGLLVWVLLLAAVIAVVVALLRWSRPGQPAAPGPTTPGARDVLDERFARGDIDADEYTERRRVLEGR